MWEDHLYKVVLFKPAEVVQEMNQVLEKHGCHVEELKCEFCYIVFCQVMFMHSHTYTHTHTHTLVSSQDSPRAHAPEGSGDETTHVYTHAHMCVTHCTRTCMHSHTVYLWY